MDGKWQKRSANKQDDMEKESITCSLILGFCSGWLKTAKTWARPGFEPGTSRTLSENHTPRPTSQTPDFEATTSSGVTGKQTNK